MAGYGSTRATMKRIRIPVLFSILRASTKQYAMSTQPVRLRHPGYPTPNILLTFAASDGENRDHIHYATVWVACSVILNNRTDHWLSPSRAGAPRAAADASGFLPAGDYFLHIPGADTDTIASYSIVPNFRSWQFPHDGLPDLWHEASANDKQLAAEQGFSIEAIAIESCRITERCLAIQDAHVIPKEEKPWFATNELEQYGTLSTRSGDTVADTLPNIVRLRSDAHYLWDKSDFSIVPRSNDPLARGVSWYTQVLNDGEELHKYWHGIKLQSLAGRPSQYLFARFAFDIFPRLHTFLRAGRERALIVCRLDGTLEDRKYSSPECRRFTENQGQNRSASPTKRSRSQANIDDLEREKRSLSSSGRSISNGADSAVGGLCSRFIRADGTEHDYDTYEDRGRKRHKVFV